MGRPTRHAAAGPRRRARRMRDRIAHETAPADRRTPIEPGPARPPSSSTAFTPTRCSRESRPGPSQSDRAETGQERVSGGSRARPSPRHRSCRHHRHVRERRRPGRLLVERVDRYARPDQRQPQPGFGLIVRALPGCALRVFGPLSERLDRRRVEGRQRARLRELGGPARQAGRRPVRRRPPGLGLPDEQGSQAERPRQGSRRLQGDGRQPDQGAAEAGGHRPVQAGRRERHQGLSGHLRLQRPRHPDGSDVLPAGEGPLRLLDHRSGERPAWSQAWKTLAPAMASLTVKPVTAK